MKTITTSLVSALLLLTGCANQQMQDLGSTLLSSTGLVDQSHARSLFQAGGKLAAAASPLSLEQEYYLGRGVSAMILSQYTVSKNQALNSYVNRVGNVVAAYSDVPETFGGYHFAVLDTDEVNALSAPGGFVFVSRGFLKLIPNEDALAAVLAHEVGHIVKGHGVKAISQANMTDAVMILGKQAVSDYSALPSAELTELFGDSVTQVFDALIKNGYSRSQEYEADAYAAELLKRTGYASKSLITMLTALEGQKASSGGWYDTHPAPGKRIDELETAVKNEPAETAGFKTRTARYKQSVRL